MWPLLDADPEIPWPDQPLVFHHKYRLWVQPYNESYHTPVHYGRDTSLLVGSPWEYMLTLRRNNYGGATRVLAATT